MDLIDRGSGRMGLSAAVPPRGGRVKVLLHEVRWASATGKGAITRPAHPPRRRRKPEVRGREAARVESLHSRTSQAVTGDAAGSPVLRSRRAAYLADGPALISTQAAEISLHTISPGLSRYRCLP